MASSDDDGLEDVARLHVRARPGRPGLIGGSHKVSVLLDAATYDALQVMAAGRVFGAVVREVLQAGLSAQRVEQLLEPLGGERVAQHP